MSRHGSFHEMVTSLAGEKDGKKQENKPQKREDQLSHLNIDLAPTSPQPSQSSDHPGLLSRENSMQASSSVINLPPDAQKFLKFAGRSCFSLQRQKLRTKTLISRPSQLFEIDDIVNVSLKF